jgi:hypothetical protein
MKRRALAGAAAVASILTLTAVGPCGEVKELRTASQAREYVVDAIQGKAGEWDALADDATIEAKLVWAHESEIETLSRQLREKAEWACEAADAASKVNDAYESFQEFPQESKEEILAYFEILATPEEVEAIYDEVLRLDPLEVVLVTSQLCP